MDSWILLKVVIYSILKLGVQYFKLRLCDDWNKIRSCSMRSKAGGQSKRYRPVPGMKTDRPAGIPFFFSSRQRKEKKVEEFRSLKKWNPPRVSIILTYSRSTRFFGFDSNFWNLSTIFFSRLNKTSFFSLQRRGAGLEQRAGDLGECRWPLSWNSHLLVLYSFTDSLSLRYSVYLGGTA